MFRFLLNYGLFVNGKGYSRILCNQNFNHEAARSVLAGPSFFCDNCGFALDNNIAALQLIYPVPKKWLNMNPNPDKECEKRGDIHLKYHIFNELR